VGSGVGELPAVAPGEAPGFGMESAEATVGCWTTGSVAGAAVGAAAFGAAAADPATAATVAAVASACSACPADKLALWLVVASPEFGAPGFCELAFVEVPLCTTPLGVFMPDAFAVPARRSCIAGPVAGSTIFGKVDAADSVPGPGLEKKTENGVWLAADPLSNSAADDVELRIEDGVPEPGPALRRLGLATVAVVFGTATRKPGLAGVNCAAGFNTGKAATAPSKIPARSFVAPVCATTPA
jgi:hypothetical protein